MGDRNTLKAEGRGGVRDSDVLRCVAGSFYLFRML